MFCKQAVNKSNSKNVRYKIAADKYSLTLSTSLSHVAFIGGNSGFLRCLGNVKQIVNPVSISNFTSEKYTLF